MQMKSRRSVRVQWHDYDCGLYFITICTNHHNHYFGTIENKQMHLSEIGDIVKRCINEIPVHHNNVEIIEWVVMPNHLHMLISVEAGLDRRTDETGCLKPPKYDIGVNDKHFNSGLAITIGTFKAAVSRELKRNGIRVNKLWQRNYHEHIVRNKDNLRLITEYIVGNVLNWERDCFYKH